MYKKGMFGLDYMVEIALGVFFVLSGILLLAWWSNAGRETAIMTFSEPVIVSVNVNLTDPNIITPDSFQEDIAPAAGDCTFDYSCDNYFVYVPLDDWDSD